MVGCRWLIKILKFNIGVGGRLSVVGGFGRSVNGRWLVADFNFKILYQWVVGDRWLIVILKLYFVLCGQYIARFK